MRTRLLVLSFSLVLGAPFLGLACGGKKMPPKEPPIAETVTDAGAEPPKPKSLFDRLGGKEGITKIVDSFVAKVMADAKISKRFAKTTGPKLDKFKENMVDLLCKETEGGCAYDKSMRDVHKGMKIREEEWQAIVLDLKAALDDAKIGEDEQSDLISQLGAMHDDILEVKTKPAAVKK